jgi:multiple sugar transport system ATP-binding protein
VAVQATDLQAGDTVHVGVRPEHIPLTGSHPGGSGASLPARVQHVERLGDSSLLYVELGSAQALATVKVEGSATQSTGATVHLYLQPEQLHLFGPQGLACPRTVSLPV